MRRAPLLLAFLIVLPLSAAERSRYIVLTRTLPHAAGVRMIDESTDAAAHAVRAFGNIDAFAADLTPEEAATLRNSRNVRSVQPIVKRSAADAPAVAVASMPIPEPSDPQVVPYGIDMVHAREVWGATRGGNVNLAILDTGIDYHHPDLQGVLAGMYNTYTNSSDAFDDNRHGTHVAGTVAAQDNSIGVVGVAPGVRLWAVKVLDQYANGTDEQVVAGVDWVLSKKKEIGGNWIMSLSLAGLLGTDAEKEAFQRAVDEGILVVAASGNYGAERPEYPAAYPGVLAVGAVDSSGSIATFSDRGVGIVAPGVQVLSTIPVGGTRVGNVTPANGASLTAWGMRGSPLGETSGEYVYCGLGSPEEIPSTVAGKIALIRRGDLHFRDKMMNVIAKGARAAVFFNDLLLANTMSGWSLIDSVCDPLPCHDSPADLVYQWPLAVGISYADGATLLTAPAGTTIEISNRQQIYAVFNGTSMATPHVSAAAALVWSLMPSLTAVDVRNVMESTAHDLGPAGFDPAYGAGLLDALAAARAVSPESFPPRRRPSQH